MALKFSFSDSRAAEVGEDGAKYIEPTRKHRSKKQPERLLFSASRHDGGVGEAEVTHG